MGSGTFDAKAYRSFASTTVGKTADEIYTCRSLNKDLDPKGVGVRESRDSRDNPESTPIIVALDVTGSMGMIAEVIAKHGLGTLFTELLTGKVIRNPHIMFMAVGDANCDKAPLQVSQFEADNRIVGQLSKIWIEHGGGGNNFESYNLPWYFAARHTVHDSMIKRGKRGYLFTVGDEQAPEDLTRKQLAQFIGDTPESDVSTKAILAEAQRRYDVFHVVIEEGDYARSRLQLVKDSWRPLLGQKVIQLSDHTKLAETIVSAIEVSEGCTESISRRGSVVVEAVKSLPASRMPRRLALRNSH